MANTLQNPTLYGIGLTEKDLRMIADALQCFKVMYYTDNDRFEAADVLKRNIIRQAAEHNIQIKTPKA